LRPRPSTNRRQPRWHLSFARDPYKAANNLQRIPTPTINFNFQDKLDQINGTAPFEAEAAPPAAAAAAAAAASAAAEVNQNDDNEEEE
jgi:hypothetical protein